MSTPHDRIEAAFHAAPRQAFLPRGQRRFAGADQALPIGHHQTNSQPSTVRRMLELLDVQEGQRVLDVGSGSGWTTALLALLVGPTGTVYAVERIDALVVTSGAVLAELDLPWAHVERTEGALGRPATAPYDRILVSAQAKEIPEPLVQQLEDGGVMVVPVAGRLARVVRRGSAVDLTWHGHYRFVPLIT